MALTKLIAGNWKMNGLAEDGRARVESLAAFMEHADASGFEMLVCPPATLLSAAVGWAGESGIRIGGQDCHFEENGAHTGDISALMLKDAGCDTVIIGHSERRADHAEGNAMVKRKAAAAHAAGLVAIVCVGEQEGHRNSGTAEKVVGEQLADSIPEGATSDNTVVAYEPVWAIGTGKTATVDDVREMHAFIRAQLDGKIENADKVRILYGGSVKPDNAKELMAVENVDGVLVGGASLKAEDFQAIAEAA